MLEGEQNSKTRAILGFRAISINRDAINMSSKEFKKKICKMWVGVSSLEELEKAQGQIKGIDKSHSGIEWIWKKRTFKSRRGKWERRECIQTESECGSRGWEEKLLWRAYGRVILEVENWYSLTQFRRERRHNIWKVMKSLILSTGFPLGKIERCQEWGVSLSDE